MSGNGDKNDGSDDVDSSSSEVQDTMNARMAHLSIRDPVLPPSSRGGSHVQLATHLSPPPTAFSRSHPQGPPVNHPMAMYDQSPR